MDIVKVKRFLEDGFYDDAEILLDSLMDCSSSDIIEILSEIGEAEITPANIPQYSNFYCGSTMLIDYLKKIGNDGPSFSEIGIHYLGGRKKEGAYKKFGENHAKLAVLLKLVEFRYVGRTRVYLTDIGFVVERMPEEKQLLCLARLAAGIPIIQYCVRKNICDREMLENVLEQHLSASTARRRNRNVYDILEYVKGNKDEFKKSNRIKKNI